MSGSKKKTPAEELIESLLKDVGDAALENPEANEPLKLQAEDAPDNSQDLEGLVLPDLPEDDGFKAFAVENEYEEKTENEFDSNEGGTAENSVKLDLGITIDDEKAKSALPDALGALLAESQKPVSPTPPSEPNSQDARTVTLDVRDENQKTEFIGHQISSGGQTSSDSEKTVAVAGFQVRDEADYGDKIKISVGQNRSGYSNWNNVGTADSNLAQAENLRMAQDKIIDLERENEKLRLQNEELMAASEIIKERSDLLSSQLNEYKNDRDGLEESYKNEVVLLKNHLARKDTELQRVQFKAEELESRLKFDMKKIRVRERELENRLELIRAEKNAIVKNKDEQILDLRRKMDVLQMEVESYRQKCIELNKMIESSQESFKRTTRALRLAMANLELQEENKAPLKKVD